jgi:hypothetical protein
MGNTCIYIHSIYFLFSKAIKLISKAKSLMVEGVHPHDKMALDLDQYSAMLSFGLIAPKSFKII